MLELNCRREGSHPIKLLESFLLLAWQAYFTCIVIVIYLDCGRTSVNHNMYTELWLSKAVHGALKISHINKNLSMPACKDAVQLVAQSCLYRDYLAKSVIPHGCFTHAHVISAMLMKAWEMLPVNVNSYMGAPFLLEHTVV